MSVVVDDTVVLAFCLLFSDCRPFGVGGARHCSLLFRSMLRLLIQVARLCVGGSKLFMVEAIWFVYCDPREVVYL